MSNLIKSFTAAALALCFSLPVAAQERPQSMTISS